MTNENTPEIQPSPEEAPAKLSTEAAGVSNEPTENFGELLAQFEKSHSHASEFLLMHSPLE